MKQEQQQKAEASTMAMALDQREGNGWIAWHGDCVEVMRGMPDGAVDLTVTSIPFANLFCYSNSDHDLGNSSNHAQFFEQFDFAIREWMRVTKPGRIAAVHLMNLPSLKQRDGHIGLIDFRGEVIRRFVAAGWIYHSETTVWKDPVTAAQRTKALGLLYKQLQKDSCMSRMGIPDYVCFFRRPGENPARVSHKPDDFPLARWQEWASPVWMDIDQSRTLQARSVREEQDEAHLCALQLDVIERCVELYSNAGDVVFDPFGGIGSTGVIALERQRRAVLVELKASYYAQLVANLAAAEPNARGKQTNMFDTAEAAQ